MMPPFCPVAIVLWQGIELLAHDAKSWLLHFPNKIRPVGRISRHQNQVINLADILDGRYRLQHLLRHGPNPASPAARQEIHVKVVGRQFYWTFYYPNGKYSVRTLEIPVNVPIEISTESLDVIHGFWVPQLGAKIDALPGIVNHAFIEGNKIGTYGGQCYEFCGLGHDQMLITVKVVTMAQYQSYVQHLST
jgi:heme/copper-type cytochrome/quinol oxidase subunit 2